MFSLISFTALFVFARLIPHLREQMTQLTGEPLTAHQPTAQLLVGMIVVAAGEASFGLMGAAATVVIWSIQWLDWDTQMIPDSLQLVGLALALAYNGLQGGFWQWNLLLAGSISGGLVLIGVLYAQLSGRPAMGWGDVKFIGWLLILGGESLLFWMVAAAAVSLLAFLFVSRWDATKVFPFAPVLSCSAIIYYGGIALG